MAVSSTLELFARGRRLDLDALEANAGKPSAAIYAALLRDCGYSRTLSAGKRVHDHMQATGFDREKVLGDLLVQMYGQCRSLDDAREAFDKLERRDVYSWSIMISAYAKNGDFEMAIESYERMQREGVEPDMFVYSSVIAAFCALGDLEQGTAVHARIVESGLTPDVVVQNSLVNLYATCGCIDQARNLFDGMRVRSLASWNAMIAGYAKLGRGDEAFLLFRRVELDGLEANVVTFVNLLGACGSEKDLEAGRAIHSRVKALGLVSNQVLATALLNMYSKCSSVWDSWTIFVSMKERSQVPWNAMIAAFVEHCRFEEAMQLYNRMHLVGLKPNNFTLASILGACNLQQGIVIHARVTTCGFHTDRVVNTALVNMYSRNGCMAEARAAFDSIPGKDTVAWNAMIGGYVEAGCAEEAIQLFQEMQAGDILRDSSTFIAAANACSLLGDLTQAREIHSAAAAAEVAGKECVVLQNTILYMYSKCGSLEETRACFNRMDRPSVVSWNLLISCCVEQQEGEQAFTLLRQMDCSGTHPNAFTLASITAACKSLGAAKCLHARIAQAGFDSDPVTATAVVTMYGACGDARLATSAFAGMPRPRGTLTWNALLATYAQHGLYGETVEMLWLMWLEGEAAPDASSAAAVVEAASHGGGAGVAGVADVEGAAGVAADVVDALARSGRLEVAEAVAEAAAEVGVWRRLLGACAVHGDVGRGVVAAERVLDIQPESSAPYVMLSNIAKQHPHQ